MAKPAQRIAYAVRPAAAAAAELFRLNPECQTLKQSLRGVSLMQPLLLPLSSYAAMICAMCCSVPDACAHLMSILCSHVSPHKFLLWLNKVRWQTGTTMPGPCK